MRDALDGHLHSHAAGTKVRVTGWSQSGEAEAEPGGTRCIAFILPEAEPGVSRSSISELDYAQPPACHPEAPEATQRLAPPHRGPPTPAAASTPVAAVSATRPRSPAPARRCPPPRREDRHRAPPQRPRDSGVADPAQAGTLESRSRTRSRTVDAGTRRALPSRTRDTRSPSSSAHCRSRSGSAGPPRYIMAPS